MDLRDIRKARLRIESLHEQITRLRSTMEMGAHLLNAGGGSNYPTDRLAQQIARLDELERALVAESLDYELEVIIADESLERLSETEQAIARARYVDGLSWSEVAKETNYSVGYCRNINLRIIEKIA